MNKTMYLSVGTAKPNSDNSLYTKGKNQPLLVFAQANSVNEAIGLSREHLESTGWEEVLMDKTDPVDAEAIKSAEPEVQNAYQSALKDGSHGMALQTLKGKE
ncbi:MAG: hypothetical protein COB04_13930 [Gammaproteobacteria bacterium]|nr:MAG: hypothetical protein COB04_13930 [Gammaproteobacteria bacterium]